VRKRWGGGDENLWRRRHRQASWPSKISIEFASNISKLTQLYPVVEDRGDKLKILDVVERWVARERRVLKEPQPRVIRQV